MDKSDVYSYELLVKQKFSQLIKSYQSDGKKYLIALKGFPFYTVKWMIADMEDISCINAVVDNEILNIGKLSVNSKSLLIDLITKNSSVMICLYEQYLSISEFLNSETNLIDRKVVVVENNLFVSLFPSLLSVNELDVLEEHFSSENVETSDNIAQYLRYYSDVDILWGNMRGVKYVDKIKDEKLSLIPFFDNTADKTPPSNTSFPVIDINSLDFSEFIFILETTGRCEPKKFVSTSYNTNRILSLNCIVNLLNNMQIPYAVEQFNPFDSIQQQSDTYLYILRKYWGNNAQFRKLLFYKNPNFSNDVIELSQGAIISNIIAQSEASLAGNKEFRNIFVTAPTGSGKSILFQIPAVYLAENYNALTIVVTPLIALMKDQVDNLGERGVNCATYLNSSISLEEKERRVVQIKSGEKSIVYLAPEMLLSTPLETLIGNRKVGLFVVDEAHIVTSWGRDFRADYWFLGDYLIRCRRQGVYFPILCLTATAVYGGKEDVVNDTISTLSLNRTIIYLGSVKRNNIVFDIHHIDSKDIVGSYEDDKINRTVEAIQYYIDHDKKSLVYCPYTTQVQEVVSRIPPEISNKVSMYHGQLPKIARSMAQETFKSSISHTMVCTKAFGMGVDVADITNCYHFAPTGNLSDYVQEIGRIARIPDIVGTARIDFSNADMRYVRILRGISGLKQYQLREMLRKLYDIYSTKQKRNLLVSPDVFSYLYGDKDIGNKVKNGLLLLSKDLEQKYGFPVINVRPKAMFTKGYVCVSSNFENDFVQRYCSFIKKQYDQTTTIVKSKRPDKHSDVTVANYGHIYEVDMSKIWELDFSELTFADFKRKFFDGELFSQNGVKQFWPRLKIRIKYKRDFDEVCNILDVFLEKLTQIFTEFKEAASLFTFEDFREKFKEYLIEEDINITSEFVRLIFELFVVEVKSHHYQQSCDYQFIQAKRINGKEGMAYRIIGTHYLHIKNKFLSMLAKKQPFTQDNCYVGFVLPLSGEKGFELTKLLSILELIDIASYELTGGSNVEIFIRINDPMKVKYLSYNRYSNQLLREMKLRKFGGQYRMLEGGERIFTAEQTDKLLEFSRAPENFVRDSLLNNMQKSNSQAISNMIANDNRSEVHNYFTGDIVVTETIDNASDFLNDVTRQANDRWDITKNMKRQH